MRRALSLLVGLAVAAVLAEGLAVSFWDESGWLWELTPRQVSDVEVHRISEDPRLVYELRPNSAEMLDGPYGDRFVRINSLGFRGDEPAEGEYGFRVACLGGSNTFGASVSDHETWPARLQERLRVDHPDAEVFNLGVEGWMTRQKASVDIAELDVGLVLFQIYNEGRRFVLEGTLESSYARFPELWSENFAGPRLPFSSGRLAVLGINRVFQDRIVHQKTELAAQADREAFEAFVLDSPVEVVVVFPPVGGSDSAIRDLGLQVIDLAEHDQPFGDEGLDLHPQAKVYEWYADVIAAELEGRGLLPP